MNAEKRFYRKLAGASACGALLLAGVAAGSHWHHIAKPAGMVPAAAALQSVAREAKPPQFAPPSVAIPPATRRTLSLKPSHSELHAAAASTSAIPPASRAQAVKVFAALPMTFEANDGQSDPRVKFLARAAGYTLFLTDKEAVVSLAEAPPETKPAPERHISFHQPDPHPKEHKAAGATHVVRLKFSGVSAPTAIAGRGELPGKSNYFIGNDPKQWHTSVPNYSAVEYRGLYSGVDAVFHGDNRRLEFDFDIAPGANPRTIALEVEGAKRMRLNSAGDVVVDLGGAQEVLLGKPHVYQASPEGRREVASNFVMRTGHRIGFALGAYDHAMPLVIDPSLAYSTYLGGSTYEYASAIAVDSSGSAYVTGVTSSTNFPTVDPYQSTCAGCSGESGYISFVTKFNPAGSALVYSTYFGGGTPRSVVATAIAVDSSGDAYLTGYALAGLPTVNAYEGTYGASISNAFVTKLNPAGSALVYSTYLGGSYFDEGFGIAVDSSGSAYVTGLANSKNFPTVNPIQATCGNCSAYGEGNAFVTKFNAAGSALVYSTYLGGSGSDWANALAVDSSGNAYVTGITTSTNFPTANPFQASNASTSSGGSNAFVAKLNSAGSALAYSTYLGGSDEDFGAGIAADSSGSAYVTGFAQSPNFPTANAYQATMAGVNDAFVTKFNAAGSALIYSTYLGGSSADEGFHIAVDAYGNAYVTGYTGSSNFPRVNSLQNYGGSIDAFVTKLNATGSALVFSSYLGGSSADYGYAIAVDSSGNAYVAGLTQSTNFPTESPFQASDKNSNGTAFVTKVALSPSTTLSISPTTVPGGTEGVAYSPVDFVASGATGTVTFAVTSGSLPTGMTPLPSDGVLSGTPTQTGTFPFTLTAADTNGDTGSQAYSLQICPTITVGPSTLPTGTVGTAYSAVTFTETGGAGTPTFSETGLPTSIGMSFSAGTLTGTPTQAGSYPITFTATDSNGCTGSVSDTLTINSSTTPPPPAVITDNETITVSDADTFPDVLETITVTDTDFVVAEPAALSISAPVPYFSAGSIGFGSQSGSQTLDVSNIGGASLTLDSASISGSSAFVISQTACSNGATSLSTTLAPVGACGFTITYTASANPANDTATLAFSDNAGLSNLTTTGSAPNYTQSVPLTGSGTTTTAPPPPPTTVSVTDDETITVTDTVSVQLSQTITATPPAEARDKDSFTVSATGGASGNPLVFSSSGDCANVGATYVMGTKAGTCSGEITQAGNANYLAAPAFTWSTTVITKLVAPAVSLTGPASAYGGSSFTVTAMYPNTPGVPIEVPTITSTGPCSAGAVSGSGTTYQATVTMTKGSGTCTTRAKWAANFYYAAASADEKTTAEEITPTVSFTGAPASAANGSNFTVTATSNETGAYASAPTITATGGDCTVGSVSSTGTGTYQATVTMTKATGTCTTTANWRKTIEYEDETLTQTTIAN